MFEHCPTSGRSQRSPFLRIDLPTCRSGFLKTAACQLQTRTITTSKSGSLSCSHAARLVHAAGFHSGKQVTMKRGSVHLGLVGRGILLLLTWPAATDRAFADPIYIQRPAGNLGGSASQRDPTNVLPFQFTGFDNFILPTNASLNRVEWFGSYSAPVHEPVVESLIAFWSDQAGLPGQLLRSYRTPGSAFERFVESDTLFTGFRYGTDLGIPFDAAANTKYWMSIQLTVAFPPQWFWRDGQGGDDRSAEITGSVSDKPAPFSHDRAFALFTSTPAATTPEPSALILISTGIAGLVRRRWCGSDPRPAQSSLPTSS